MRGVDVVVASVAHLPAPTVLVDGRSGSGKSSIARAVAVRLGAVLVRLDDLYPGWSGLAEASAAVHDDLLLPRSRGLVGRWRRWDWTAAAPAELHRVPAHVPLVVEGCGALSARHRHLADLGVWLDMAPGERRRRALARDGDAHLPWWEHWAAEEQRFIDRCDPRGAADLLLRG